MQPVFSHSETSGFKPNNNHKFIELTPYSQVNDWLFFRIGVFMDNTSFKEVTKTDRFEILAMLREAKKRNGSVEFTYGDKILSSHFIELDLSGFQVIAEVDDVTLDSTFSMVIQGSTEKIEFDANLIAHSSAAHQLTFSFPSEIVITQRRSSVRVTIPEQFGFICEGRFRDGYVHRMVIKDLSSRGVQLICSETLPTLTKPGMLLKSMTLNLQNYGQYPVDLTLLNVKEITHFANSSTQSNYFSLACAFSKPSPTLTRRIEDVSMELTLDIKRLQRIR